MTKTKTMSNVFSDLEEIKKKKLDDIIYNIQSSFNNEMIRRFEDNGISTSQCSPLNNHLKHDLDDAKAKILTLMNGE